VAAGSPAPSTEPVPGPGRGPGRGPASVSPTAPLPAAAERDFRDGLRTLLAGDPASATTALDRACSAPSNSQDDGCYWAAVARLRSGDHHRARRGLGDMLARWPGSTHVGEANVALGWLLLEVGDTAGARTRFAAAAADRLESVRASALRGLAAAR
jgi:TolA-binding protein